jgi:hypothetical protein
MADDGNMSIEDLIKAIKTMDKDDQNKIKSKIGDKDSSQAKEDLSGYNANQIKALAKQNQLLAETAELLGDTATAAEQRVKQSEREIEAIIQKLELNENVAKQVKEMMEDYRKFGELEEGALSTLNSMNPELQEQIKLHQERVDLEEGLNLIRKDGIPLIEKAGKLVGLQAKYSNSAFGQTASLMKTLSAGGVESKRAMKALKKTFLDTFSVQNIALNIFNALKKNSIAMLKNFDSASAALAKTTGQGRKFQATLYDVAREGNQFGISMDNAQAAIGTLVDQTSNFTNLSKATAQNIALTVAQMEKLGVSTADSAKIFQNFNQGLGISAEESAKMQVELAMAGTSIGISSAKITKDFNASLSTLMVYGRESLDVFKGLAAAAKAAGVETSTLLGIASKFDTFAGAAEGVGKLNALLGTQLSTTEMLMATEDERIKMLVESVQAGGVAFKDMDRFQQKAIASAAGITDMAEANRIFGMSLEAYEENERKLKASADAQKKMEEALAPTVKLMDTMKILGQEMVVALKPVIEKLQEMADFARETFGDMETETKELWATVGLLVSGLILLAPIFASGGMLLTGLATTVGTLGMMAGASTATAGGITATGTAAAAATPALAALSVPLAAVSAEVVGIVGSIALAIGAVALLAIAVVAAVGVVVYAFKVFFDFVLEGFALVNQGFSLMFSTSEAEVEMEGFKARSMEAMADVAMSMGTDDSVVERTAAMVAEINKLGQDVKVSSTIENLALLTAGTATSITGKKVSASTTNVTAKVQNFFEGMQMTLSVDGEEFKGYVENISEKVAGEVAGGERVV